MAILQSRMIALINAAQDYRQAFQALCTIIQAADERVAAGLQSPADAFTELVPIARGRVLLQRPETSASTIDIEHYHFARNKKYNERQATKLAAARRDAAVQERNHQTNPLATTELYGPAIKAIKVRKSSI